jgi:hypothetical protein
MERLLHFRVGADVVFVTVGVDHLVHTPALECGQELPRRVRATAVDQQSIHPVGCSEVEWLA